MSAPKFTPAPWSAGPSREIRGEVNGERVVIADVWVMPCIGGHDDVAAQRGCDMETANAALVAAAPELYAAVAYAIDNPEFDSAEFDQLARAALAKARGETP